MSATVTTIAAVAKAVEAQYIVTGCGTVHQIPTNATSEKACDYLDAWSRIDCQ